MKNRHPHHHPPEQADCPRTRLAEGSLVAVDACQCGMLQLHLGAMTLRMAPCALAELADTLNRAVAAHGRKFAMAGSAEAAFGVTRERGEA